MAHLVILLDGWDWIQLSNIHKLVLKHGTNAVRITTLQPASLTAALGALVNGDKLHVVGHGGANCFADDAGTTPAGLADLIHQHLPADTDIKIRVDTCSSAEGDQNGNSTARTMRDRLQHHGRQRITVSGTVGPSVTGAPGRRIVVAADEVDRAGDMQTMLERVHKSSIDRAVGIVMAVERDSTDAQIKTIAERCHMHTKNFFGEFAGLLNRSRNLTVPHGARAHKIAFAA